MDQGNGLRPTFAATRQPWFRQRTACASPERHSWHVGYAIARSKYNADECELSALRKWQEQHGSDDKQNLTRGLSFARGHPVRANRARRPSRVTPRRSCGSTKPRLFVSTSVSSSLLLYFRSVEQTRIGPLLIAASQKLSCLNTRSP